MRRIFLAIALVFCLCSFSFAQGLDSDTKLLLHCDGADESTTFTDESDNEHTVTANGNAQVDTTYKEFGTGSLKLDGSGDYLTVADSSDFNTSSGDVTFDTWFKIATSQRGAIIWDEGELYPRFGLQYGTATALYLYASETGTSNKVNVTVTVPAMGTSWHHLAIVQNSSGNTFRVYLDGVQEYTRVKFTFWNSNAGYLFGIFYDLSNFPFSGYMDEIRVSDTARWTSAFTPPTVAYSVESSGGRKIYLLTKFVKRENGDGYDRIQYRQNFGWNGIRG